MADHGSSENGINLSDGLIGYRDLDAVVNEASAGFAQLYAYGVSKCQFIACLTGRPIHYLEDLQCATLDSFIHTRWCNLTCHKFLKLVCETITAHYLCDCLMYYLQTKISSKVLTT